jgi:hypothetical protein
MFLRVRFVTLAAHQKNSAFLVLDPVCSISEYIEQILSAFVRYEGWVEKSVAYTVNFLYLSQS